MNKTIVAFAAVAAMTLTAGVAEAGSRGKSTVNQAGNFSSGFANVSPTIGILNGSSVLSNIGIGVLGTGILSTNTTNTTTVTRNSGNSGNSYGSFNKSGAKNGRRW